MKFCAQFSLFCVHSLDYSPQSGKTYYADADGTELTTQPTAGDDISSAGYFEAVADTCSFEMHIAHFDYMYCFGYAGNSYIGRHHLAGFLRGGDIRERLDMGYSLNSQATTSGGYAYSEIRRTGLKRVKHLINAAIGEGHILEYQDYLVNAVTNGIPSGTILTDCSVELLSEVMLIGHREASARMMSGMPLIGFASTQMALFKLKRQAWLNIGGRLRDVCDSQRFVCTAWNGSMSSVEANLKGTMLPFFLLR